MDILVCAGRGASASSNDTGVWLCSGGSIVAVSSKWRFGILAIFVMFFSWQASGETAKDSAQTTETAVDSPLSKHTRGKKCVACHKFDTKVVGPPYKETVPKYNGDVQQLAEYIYNPVKKDPAYPPMPNQGLKKKEAVAVAQYLLDHLAGKK